MSCGNNNNDDNDDDDDDDDDDDNKTGSNSENVVESVIETWSEFNNCASLSKL